MNLPLRVAARYHERQLRQFYARLKASMSLDEAKATLGFPPSANPTPAEVARNYKQLAFKLHPDRGGDPAKMVEVNVARDILENPKLQDRGQNAPGYGGGTPTTYAPTKREEITVSFEEAKSNANIPSGVKWHFVTESHHSGYSSNEYLRRASGWVAVGETDSAWVFVAAENFQSDAYVPGDTRPKEDVWSINSFSLPKKGPVDARTLYGGVMKAWKSFKYLEKKFNSKVTPAEGWVFNQRLPRGPSLSIKNYLLNSGLMDESQLKTPRKQTIEIAYHEHYGYGGKPPPNDYVNIGRGYDKYIQLELTINGKPYKLPPEATLKLVKLRVKGKPFIDRVFGDYPEHSRPKSLTRNRDGKPMMGWMAENLPGLPDWVKSSLEAASTQSAAKGRRR